VLFFVIFRYLPVAGKRGSRFPGSSSSPAAASSARSGWALHYVQHLPERPHLLGRLHQQPWRWGRSRCWCSYPLPIVSRAAAQRRCAAHAFKRIVPVGVLPAALPVHRGRRRTSPYQFLAVDGAMNQLVAGRLGRAPVPFPAAAGNGSGRSTSRTEVWQTVGWGDDPLPGRADQRSIRSLYEAGPDRRRPTDGSRPGTSPCPAIRAHDHDPADPQHRHVSWQSVF